VNHFLACGTSGRELDDGERRLLAELQPGSVVLFARHVASREQVIALVEELHALPGSPLVAIDLEGGRVNRLRALLGELPSAAAAAAAGPEACRALGEAAGAACAHLGVDLDFAPVLDVAWPDGWLAREGRCWGCDGAAVEKFARAFLEGLEGYGVRACLKHYPGLGSGVVDSHRELPVLGDGVWEEERTFAALASPQRAAMVAHAMCPQLGEACAPASLSRRVVQRLVGLGCGLVLADDLEMGALAGWGGIGERGATALAAGCDQVILSNLMDERQPLAEHVRRAAADDADLATLLERGRERFEAFRQGLRRPRVDWDEVQRAADRARRLAGTSP
jgi:beta-N-acetylhexosaminidase